MVVVKRSGRLACSRRRCIARSRFKLKARAYPPNRYMAIEDCISLSRFKPKARDEAWAGVGWQVPA